MSNRTRGHERIGRGLSWSRLIRNTLIGMVLGLALGLGLGALLGQLNAVLPGSPLVGVGIAVGGTVGAVWDEITGRRSATDARRD